MFRKTLLIGILAYIVIYAALVAISFPGRFAPDHRRRISVRRDYGRSCHCHSPQPLARLSSLKLPAHRLAKQCRNAPENSLKKCARDFRRTASSTCSPSPDTCVSVLGHQHRASAFEHESMCPMRWQPFWELFPALWLMPISARGLIALSWPRRWQIPVALPPAPARSIPASLITTEVLIAMVGLGLISLLARNHQEIAEKAAPGKMTYPSDANMGVFGIEQETQTAAPVLRNKEQLT